MPRLNKIKKIFQPVSLIVFVGVDGSGKTTLIKRLGELSSAYRTVVYLGWNDYFFKFIGRLDRKIYFPIKIIENFLNRARFFLFHLLLPFDFFARYLAVKAEADSGIILADRYPLPKEQPGQPRFLPLQKIYRNFFLKLTYFLLPKPKIIFILKGEPRKLWERKKELAYERFLAEYQRCLQAKNLFNCKIVEVNTDCPVRDSLNLVYKEIKCLNE